MLDFIKKDIVTISPKEMAVELINKFNLVVLDTALGGSNKRVKECALITVDYILKMVNPFKVSYWKKVKEEIKKL